MSKAWGNFLLFSFFPIIVLIASPLSLEAKEIGTSVLQIEREQAMEQTLSQLLKLETTPAASSAVKMESGLSTVEPLVIPVGSSMPIEGKNITRFIAITPEVISVEQTTPTSITITGKNLGTTLFHVWDQGTRRSFKIQVIRPQAREIAEAASVIKQGQKAAPFKVRYQLNHNSFYRGDSLTETNRTNINVTHRVEGVGETPYGNLSYKTFLRKRGADLDVSSYTLELKEGRIGKLSDFNLSLFDTSFSGSPYTISATQVRGIQYYQKGELLSYNAFWGRERFGTFGSLSPGFEKELDSFLSGIQLRHRYSSGIIKGIYGHGDGGDRNSRLPDDVVGVELEHTVSPFVWKLGLGTDADHYGLKLSNRWHPNPWRIHTVYRDVEPDYFTLVGTASEQGERGVGLTIDYDPLSTLHFGGILDIYKNRFFPNIAEPDALNQLFTLEMSTIFWENYSFRVSYSESRLLGSLSPSETNRFSAGLGRSFRIWNRLLNTYLRYQLRDSVHRSTPSTDFESNQYILGGNLRLTNNLSMNASQEWNFVDETTLKVQSRPRASSIGFNYRIPVPRKIPLAATYSLSIRNEENTESSRSFLSGEDTLTHTIDTSYRLTPDIELFLKGSLEKIRFETNERSQIEGDIFMGMRSSFETPLRWNPRAAVVGIVYEDTNQNGYRDPDENGFEGVSILCDGKSAMTDSEGYYLVEHVQGKTSIVSLDISSLPHGYVSTGSTEKEIQIIQGEPVMVNFGILSISQIRGFVFNDLNANHVFDLMDAGIVDVTVWLDDQQSIKTDRYGYFSFGKVETGKHFIRVDIKSLPYTYLTDVPLKQEIDLSEAESYEHFFPMRTLKLIGGKVFADSNQNGRFDAGEKGIEGVKIQVGSAELTTDKEGNYLLEEVPVGVIEIRIKEESIPQPYRLSGPNQKLIEVRPEGTLAQDVHFSVD